MSASDTAASPLLSPSPSPAPHHPRALIKQALGYSDLGLLTLGMAWIVASNFITLPFFAKGLPAGIATLGFVQATPLALEAVGMVLVLRSSRIINFAQVALGAISGLLFYELVHHSQFLQLLKQACAPCLSGISNDATYNQAHGTLFTQQLMRGHYDVWLAANFWVSLTIAFVLAPILAYLIYLTIIARFNNAPRLILTVGTLAVAQLVGAALPIIRTSVFQDQRVDLPGLAYTPFPSTAFKIDPALFHVPDLILVVFSGTVLLALGVFLLFSRTGIAIRATAENPQRASTLGISVNALSGIVWFMAGTLAGAAAILGIIQAPTSGAVDGGINASLLVQLLVAVVFARMTSVPIAIAVTLAMGIIQQYMLWNLGSPVPFQGLLVVMIAVSLLLQRSKRSRAEQDATADYLAAREARPIPRELRHIGVVDAYIRYLALGAAILVLGYPFAMSPAQVSLGSLVIVYAIVGLSLLILTGWAGQVSLGQFAFAAVGAYVAAIARSRLGLDITLCLVAGGLAGAVVAVLVGLPALRLRGLQLAVSTLAFALAASQILLVPQYLGAYLPSTLDRPFYLGFDMNDEKIYFYYSLTFLLLAIGMVVGLRRSRTARALIASRDNEQAAEAFGINLFFARLTAFALSGFMAAFAGALLAFHQNGVQPATYSAEESINMFLMVVIGGLGSVFGPLLGALYRGALILFPDPAVGFLGTGMGVLLVLLLFPGGLSNLIYRSRDAMLRRVAVRRRIIVPSLLADTRIDAQDGRGGITPKKAPGGIAEYIPRRYRLDHQWEGFRGKPHG